MSNADKHQIESCQQQLIAIKAALLKQISLGKEASDIVTLDQTKVGRLSRMDAIQQQKMAETSLLQAEKRLVLVNKAILKIDAGDFGYCEHCDDFISEKRLQIQPEAVLCISCQSALETRQ